MYVCLCLHLCIYMCICSCSFTYVSLLSSRYCKFVFRDRRKKRKINKGEIINKLPLWLFNVKCRCFTRDYLWRGTNYQMNAKWTIPLLTTENKNFKRKQPLEAVWGDVRRYYVISKQQLTVVRKNLHIIWQNLNENWLIENRVESNQSFREIRRANRKILYASYQKVVVSFWRRIGIDDK